MEHNVQMLSNRSNEVLSYWYSLRRTNKAPLRTELDPTAIRARLPDLFMLGWHELDLVFRLAGTRICDLFGEELRDQTFNSLWRQQAHDHIIEAALSALRSEQPIVCDVTAIQDGKTITIEMLLLPLRSPDGTCDRLLGSLFPGKEANLSYIVEPGSLSLLNWQPAQRPGFDADFVIRKMGVKESQSLLKRLFQLI